LRWRRLSPERSLRPPPAATSSSSKVAVFSNSGRGVKLSMNIPAAHAPGTEEGRAATTTCSTNRHHRCHACSRRIASSLRADMIFGRDSDRRAMHVSFRNELLRSRYPSTLRSRP
jgi:hypothetical protein